MDAEYFLTAPVIPETYEVTDNASILSVVCTKLTKFMSISSI